jgi:hypothetical protein
MRVLRGICGPKELERNASFEKIGSSANTPYQIIYLSIYLPIYSCCSNLEHRASVKRFVSLQFLNLRHSLGLLGRVISPTEGRYLHRTTKTQNKRRQTSMTWGGGIWTHDPSVRAGENISCLRPRGHCDWLTKYQSDQIKKYGMGETCNICRE